MKLSRVTTTLSATACAVLIGLASSASAAPTVPNGPQPNPPGHPLLAPDALNQQPQLEDQFVPITPCRIVDTRAGGGALAAGTIRDFYVGGTVGFAPQGGKSGGCGIPIGATSIAAVLTAVTPSHAGFLRAWPQSSPEPAATILNYSTVTSGTGATLSIKANGAPALRVHNYAGATQLVIDVTGYYADPIEGLIYTGSTSTPASDGYVYSGSPRLLSVTWIATGIADVKVDRDVTYCTPVANAYYGDFYYANAKAFNGNLVRVYSWSIDPTTHATAYVNNYVYLTVHC
jgi:hypothetical protein